MIASLWAIQILGYKVPGFPVKDVLTAVARMALAALLMGEAVWLVARVVGGNSGVDALVRVLVGATVGAVVYLGVPPPASHPHATDHLVDPAPERPQGVGGVPAPVAADTGDGRKRRRLARPRRGDALDVFEDRAAGPVRILGRRRRRRLGGRAVHPGGLDLEIADDGQCPLDGLIEGVGPVVDDLTDVALGVDHDVVDEAVDQGSGQAVGEQRHPIIPGFRTTGDCRSDAG